MNHELLKSVIFDQQDVIRNARIVLRRYQLEAEANYVITGLRRAGKSTLLYDIARKLVERGVDWSRIIYIPFEDERLAEFSLDDFNDILLVQHELSEQSGYFFLDEVQNIPGWEKFARRLADSGRHVFITGSNATMLSGEIASTLGGRYLIQQVIPYRLDEYLDALNISHTPRDLLATESLGRILSGFDAYFHNGGFPESLRYSSPKLYVESVYQKVLFGDIVARNGIRNQQVIRLMMKKIAETVCSELSFSSLHSMLKSIGFSAGKSTIIDYVAYAQEAYLLFTVNNAVAKFVEREGNPKYYFSDNGLLNLFLTDKDAALLENMVAIALHDNYPDELCYLKSARNGIDIDFYLPQQGTAIQVAYSIAGEARKREVENLVKLAQVQPDIKRTLILTKEEEETIEQDGCAIEVIPVWKYLLELAA